MGFAPSGLSNFGNPLTAVTPSDSTVVAFNALYVGGSGDIAVIMAGDTTNSGAGTAITVKAVPVGILPFAVKKVMATNTTATNILGITS